MAMPMKPHKGEMESDFMDRCMAEMSEDKSQDQKAAICKLAWSKDHKMESVVNQKLIYSVPIAESARLKKDFVIKGVAINEVTTRNNVRYVAEELAMSAQSLRGKPLLKDHNNSIDAIVGRVMEASFDPINRNIQFEARIVDKKIQEMIEDGLVTNVSVGAMVRELAKAEEEGADYMVARGIEFVELSLVSVPGDPNAGFAMAMSEAFEMNEKTQNEIFVADTSIDLRIKLKEESTMAEEIKEQVKPVDDVRTMFAEFKDEIKKELVQLKAELEKKETVVLEEADDEEDEEDAKEKKEDVAEKMKGLVGGMEEKNEQFEDYLGIDKVGNKFTVYAEFYPTKLKNLQARR